MARDRGYQRLHPGIKHPLIPLPSSGRGRSQAGMERCSSQSTTETFSSHPDESRDLAGLELGAHVPPCTSMVTQLIETYLQWKTSRKWLIYTF